MKHLIKESKALWALAESVEDIDSRTPLITVLCTDGLSWVNIPFIIIIIIINIIIIFMISYQMDVMDSQSRLGKNC